MLRRDWLTVKLSLHRSIGADRLRRQATPGQRWARARRAHRSGRGTILPVFSPTLGRLWHIAPVVSGRSSSFKTDGPGLERVITLTDAVVAIAMTLLVLPLVELSG